MSDQPVSEATTTVGCSEEAGRRAALLGWYDRHRRDLPWRAAPGERSDPYRVLVSEFMLQQTTAATVGRRFEPFLERFPTVRALAEADEEDVLHAWQGLGYYRRARALHACARATVREHAGRLPDDPLALRRLPGIGPYTADALAAIAFGRRVVPVDGNIRRVLARLHAIAPVRESALAEAAAGFAAAERPGDVAQALMDLGATVCTPRRPRCLVCPFRPGCRAHHQGQPEAFPAPQAPKERSRRTAVIFLLRRPDGAILVRRRANQGLLAGMHELPSSPWLEAELQLDEALAHAPAAADWRLQAEQVRHVFTHFELHLHLAAGTAAERALIPGATFWCRPDELDRLALPTVMRKVLKLAGLEPRPLDRPAEPAG